MIDHNSIFMVSLVYVGLGVFVVGLIYLTIVNYSPNNKIDKDIILITLLVILNIITISLGVNTFK